MSESARDRDNEEAAKIFAGFVPRVDPDYLDLAMSNKKVFDAHVEAGFTETQALEMTSVTVSAFLTVQLMSQGMGGDGA